MTDARWRLDTLIARWQRPRQQHAPRYTLPGRPDSTNCSKRRGSMLHASHSYDTEENSAPSDSMCAADREANSDLCRPTPTAWPPSQRMGWAAHGPLVSAAGRLGRVKDGVKDGVKKEAAAAVSVVRGVSLVTTDHHIHKAFSHGSCSCIGEGNSCSRSRRWSYNPT
eukprot:COSAG01_NODE_6076_length_3866_cov_3.010619_4_plen_167_part_00